MRSVAALLLAAVVSLLVLLFWAIWGPRRLVSQSDKSVTVLGRPLLFPVTITHTRRKPVNNQFSHRVLLIGVPVGLCGRVGHLLSIDDKQRSGSTTPWDSWFRFDSARYLHRGDEHLGLGEKLHRFLRAQNLDPARWPYAYMLSVPQWLWWSRSVVTWWYLYSPARQLDAVIMEINNSFDEKRNVLFEVRRSGSDEHDPVKSAALAGEKEEDLDAAGMIHSLPSVPISAFYQGSWEKHVYASPFEKVEGSIATRFLDPLQESSWSAAVSLSNTTSISPAGDAKLTTRISCRERPLDPVRSTALSLVWFLVRWTLPITLTTPRIIFQALRIEYLGLMKMLDKPVIQRGSVPRRASAIERTLEPFFRECLSRHIQAYPDAVEVSYLPSRALSNEPVCLRSPSCVTGKDTPARHLEVEVLEPGFFSRITQYDSMAKGLAVEMRPVGDVADTAAQQLWVSDPVLLEDLLCSGASGTDSKPAAAAGLLWRVRAWLRGSATPSAMDLFVRSSMPPSLRLLYLLSLVQHLLAKRFALGSTVLLQLYGLGGVLALRWALLQIIVSDSGQLSAAGLAVYFLTLHFFGRMTKKAIYRA
ncbi:hypothetical protein ASPZODRAFT_140459 [Penicilliopsis zonata CBS 506.65]|uniref:Uncharacterized protein n=1 Tax=Penicilliopsis zonata CBS 506.65 TaxID=1073090 RepID=A0A1L9SLL4_9EURO|nr:hypothetical protein ASPZODRAFT_140459 [Penicilliopsis zonata CBS 506.65]OJJ48129.1 hypothetical protein ASPZODRAFT_140459 [Penicilliopsis zonata CBS 506.65]